MREKWKPLLALICLTWFIFGIFTFSQIGYQYIGKSYFQSDNFQHELDNFQADLGPLVLNLPTAEELKSKITVSQHEIEEHRNYYGSLGTQIENIKSQYEEKIREAADNNANELKTKLETERDDKIKDITKNFEDDEYVRKKIVAQKGVLIDKYIKAVKDEAKDFAKNYKYLSYELTNVETGETFRSGDITDSNVYKITYTHPPLRTGSISNNSSHLLYGSDVYIESDVLNEMSEYTGTITISKKAAQYATVMDGYDQFKRNQYMFFVIWFTSLIAAFFAWKGRKELLPTIGGLKEKESLAKLRIDMQILLLFITGCIYWIFSHIAFEAIEYTYQYNYVRFLIDFVMKIIILSVIGVAFFIQVIWLYERVNTAEKLNENIKDSYLWGIGESMTDLFLNRSIALHSIVLVAAAFFGGGSFVASFAMGGGGFSIMVFGICVIVGIPALVVFLSKMGYLNRIMKDTKDMAEGRLNRDVKVKGKSPLAAHAENLNHLREGVRTSMHEQAKSERLKTELITNVSHDLRTPLTSIITYTDLLKNPDLTEEERKQYIHILDKKSDRLKVLIEDLFEVSKMASGNIELHRSRVDVTQLVQQAVGEHEEDLCKARLDLRMSMPQDAIYAYVDGQKWWRLIDNLIVNVLKYALEGTRVYVTLKRTANGDVEFTVKNVAKYEISENADELFERFKRADASRHTEGSGLGLAIAQSIVDLHGARMSIEVDGDLFKVIVRIPAV